MFIPSLHMQTDPSTNQMPLSEPPPVPEVDPTQAESQLDFAAKVDRGIRANVNKGFSPVLNNIASAAEHAHSREDTDVHKRIVSDLAVDVLIAVGKYASTYFFPPTAIPIAVERVNRVGVQGFRTFFPETAEAVKTTAKQAESNGMSSKTAWYSCIKTVLSGGNLGVGRSIPIGAYCRPTNIIDLPKDAAPVVLRDLLFYDTTSDTYIKDIAYAHVEALVKPIELKEEYRFLQPRTGFTQEERDYIMNLPAKPWGLNILGGPPQGLKGSLPQGQKAEEETHPISHPAGVASNPLTIENPLSLPSLYDTLVDKPATSRSESSQTGARESGESLTSSTRSPHDYPVRPSGSQGLGENSQNSSQRNSDEESTQRRKRVNRGVSGLGQGLNSMSELLGRERAESRGADEVSDGIRRASDQITSSHQSGARPFSSAGLPPLQPTSTGPYPEHENGRQARNLARELSESLQTEIDNEQFQTEQSRHARSELARLGMTSSELGLPSDAVQLADRVKIGATTLGSMIPNPVTTPVCLALSFAASSLSNVLDASRRHRQSDLLDGSNAYLGVLAHSEATRLQHQRNQAVIEQRFSDLYLYVTAHSRDFTTSDTYHVMDLVIKNFSKSYEQDLKKYNARRRNLDRLKARYEKFNKKGEWTLTQPDFETGLELTINNHNFAYVFAQEERDLNEMGEQLEKREKNLDKKRAEKKHYADIKSTLTAFEKERQRYKPNPPSVTDAFRQGHFKDAKVDDATFHTMCRNAYEEAMKKEEKEGKEGAAKEFGTQMVESLKEEGVSVSDETKVKELEGLYSKFCQEMKDGKVEQSRQALLNQAVNWTNQTANDLSTSVHQLEAILDCLRKLKLASTDPKDVQNFHRVFQGMQSLIDLFRRIVIPYQAVKSYNIAGNLRDKLLVIISGIVSISTLPWVLGVALSLLTIYMVYKTWNTVEVAPIQELDRSVKELLRVAYNRQEVQFWHLLAALSKDLAMIRAISSKTHNLTQKVLRVVERQEVAWNIQILERLRLSSNSLCHQVAEIMRNIEKPQDIFNLDHLFDGKHVGSFDQFILMEQAGMGYLSAYNFTGPFLAERCKFTKPTEKRLAHLPLLMTYNRAVVARSAVFVRNKKLLTDLECCTEKWIDFHSFLCSENELRRQLDELCVVLFEEHPLNPNEEKASNDIRFRLGKLVPDYESYPEEEITTSWSNYLLSGSRSEKIMADQHLRWLGKYAPDIQNYLKAVLDEKGVLNYRRDCKYGLFEGETILPRQGKGISLIIPRPFLIALGKTDPQLVEIFSFEEKKLGRLHFEYEFQEDKKAGGYVLRVDYFLTNPKGTFGFAGISFMFPSSEVESFVQKKMDPDNTEKKPESVWLNHLRTLYLLHRLYGMNVLETPSCAPIFSVLDVANPHVYWQERELLPIEKRVLSARAGEAEAAEALRREYVLEDTYLLSCLPDLMLSPISKIVVNENNLRYLLNLRSELVGLISQDSNFHDTLAPFFDNYKRCYEVLAATLVLVLHVHYVDVLKLLMDKLMLPHPKLFEQLLESDVELFMDRLDKIREKFRNLSSFVADIMRKGTEALEPSKKHPISRLKEQLEALEPSKKHPISRLKEQLEGLKAMLKGGKSDTVCILQDAKVSELRLVDELRAYFYIAVQDLNRSKDIKSVHLPLKDYRFNSKVVVITKGSSADSFRELRTIAGYSRRFDFAPSTFLVSKDDLLQVSRAANRRIIVLRSKSSEESDLDSIYETSVRNPRKPILLLLGQDGQYRLVGKPKQPPSSTPSSSKQDSPSSTRSSGNENGQFTIGEITYSRQKTKADGACAIHALLGENVDGVVSQDQPRKAYYDKLKERADEPAIHQILFKTLSDIFGERNTYARMVFPENDQITAAFQRAKDSSEHEITEDIFNRYLECIMKEDYWFSTTEIELMAHLFGKRVTLFYHTQEGIFKEDRISIGPDNGQERLIYHRGNHFEVLAKSTIP